MSESAADRVIYITPPTVVRMTDHWWDLTALDHFWVRRRVEVMNRLAEPIIRQAKAIAEVGCGNGLMQRCIEDRYQRTVSGFDLNDLALKQNISRTSPVYCYDIHQRSEEFRGKFDVVVLFDVLEHIEDESAFLQSIRYHMAPKSTLIVNVPAHQFLLSNYDRANGHYRRYSTGRLQKVLEQNGFATRAITYWGGPLAPLLLVRKYLVNLRKNERNIVSSGFDPGSKAVNFALGLLANCEPIPQKLVGTSAMGVFENRIA